MAVVGNAKSVITEAANRYGIRPDVLWGLYGTETSFGKNTSTSSAGAVGPFQFEPATAKGMGVNPYDFKSAAFGAAKYLSQYKSRGVGGMLSAYNAGPAGGYQSGYVNTTLQNAKSYGSAPSAAIPSSPAEIRPQKSETREVPNPRAQGFQQLAKLVRAEGPGSAPLASLIASKGEPTSETVQRPPTAPNVAPTASGSVPRPSQGYTNPFSGLRGYQFRKVDQGIDVGGQGPLKAVGSGRIFKVTTHDPRWEDGTFIGEELTSGPNKGKFVYYALEGQSGGANVHEGQQVSAGQRIANLERGGEFGWAAGPTIGGGNKPLQEYRPGNAPGNGPTPAGREFNQFYEAIETPHGKVVKTPTGPVYIPHG